MRPLLLLAATAALLAACGPSAPPPGTAPPPSQATCADGRQNQGEAGVDCGGPCASCAAGNTCSYWFDCESSVCDVAAGVCAAPTCSDGVKNGDEVGEDCGGSCGACPAGVECTVGTDCGSGVCLANRCDCGDETGVYVSEAAAEGGNGTIAAPLRTIQAAVRCAQMVPREIRVAAGTYEGTAGDPIALVEGKSLVGGWSADFAARSPGAHPTVIADPTDTGTTGSGVAVYLSSSSTGTVLEGFTIQTTTAGAGIGAIALMLRLSPAGAPAATIRDNVLRCGGNEAIFKATCIDLGTSGGSLVVEDNELHLGSASAADGTAAGIRDRGVPVSALEVAGNLFEGGSAAEVIAVQAASATTAVFRNNVIVVPGAGTGIDAAGAELSNNTVVGGTGTGIRTTGPGAQLRNNAISMTGGTCVAERGADADPAAVQDNDLYGCATLYLDEGATAAESALSALDAVNALAGASGNLSADPLLDAASGYRPGSGSPLLDAGVGVDLSPLFTTDKLGVTRSGWSIGAYEAALP